MKRQIALTMFCLLIFCLFCGICGASETINISGKVIPLAFDENDKVVAVSIEASDGTYYDIAPEGKGSELLTYSEKSVTVVGHLVKDADGYETLMVDSYNIVE